MNNLATRTLSGAVYLLVVLGCILFNGYLFAGFALLCMAAMMEEFFSFSIGRRYVPSRILALLTGLTLFLLIFFHVSAGLPPRFIAAAVIPLVALMISTVCSSDREHIADIAVIFTALVWIALPLALSPFVVFRDGEYSGLLILGFFVVIWCSDIGAYLIGTAFGQKKNSRKLCPSISPKKSWVGFWGGLATAVLGAWALGFTPLLPFPPVHCVVLGVLIHVAGASGDLFESQWKRHAGVKDSGNIIPGHGGILDRLDSTLMAMPLAAAYLALVNLL